jgi:hypothetical protein
VVLEGVKVLKWYFAKFKVLRWHETNFSFFSLCNDKILELKEIKSLHVIYVIFLHAHKLIDLYFIQTNKLKKINIYKIFIY